MEIISTNESLEAHFAFILAYVGKVVAYELSAELKQYFVRLVKFIDKNATVLSVGDGWNDALMMQQSDIAFELHSDAVSSTTLSSMNPLVSSGVVNDNTTTTAAGRDPNIVIDLRSSSPLPNGLTR